MSNQELKSRCQIIQQLLDTPSFYSELCNKANNDINKVIKLLAEIINYALNTNAETINIDDVRNISNTNYFIFPTNAHYYKMMSLFGLSFLPLDRRTNETLNRIDESVSLFSVSVDNPRIKIESDMEQAIKKSFISPSIVFRHILKQPNEKEEPVIVGATESSYYESILDKRINMAKSMERTSARKAKSAVSSFVGQDSLLVVIPREAIDDEDIRLKEITTSIPKNKIGFIRIPSRYTLLQICAKNKKIKDGESISIRDGSPYRKEEKIHFTEPAFTYSRYEKIYVDNSFDYIAELLTGDARYDVDIMYGAKDTNNSRETLSENADENLRKIRESGRITLYKIGDKYRISNGRHRLVYMKNYFLDHVDYCRNENELKGLKERCTVLATVIRTFEDKQVLEIIERLKAAFPKIFIEKNNSQNDLVDLIIAFNGRLYNTRNKEELIDFYKNINHREMLEKYLLVKISGNKKLDTNYVIKYLISVYKLDLINLSFSDIVNYLKENGITYQDKTYSIDCVDLNQLYLDFIATINITTASILMNKGDGLVTLNRLFR
jgi:hypothetical protein